MFEVYLVDPDGFRNVVKDGEVIGYDVWLRIPYYRGIPLSCINQVELTVDGEKVATDDMVFTIKGEEFLYDELPTAINHRWEMTDDLPVFVKKPGGLSDGEHTVAACVEIRISYQPYPNRGEDEKVLELLEPRVVEGGR